MAAARAEQIMVAFLAAITGLATTGANVYRGRAYPLEPANLPGLALYMGPDEPIAERGNAFVDWELTVIVESYAYTADGDIDTDLNLIRKEVHSAVYADPQYGLTSIVTDTRPGSIGEPETDGDGAKVTGRQRMAFTIQYRTSRTDISA